MRPKPDRQSAIQSRDLLEGWRNQTFMASREALVITDAHGKIIDWNAAAEDLFGYTRAEILGQSIAIFHDPQDAKLIVATIMRQTVREGFWEGELSVIRKDGEMRMLASRVSPLRDDLGNIAGLFGQYRDITQLKIAESEHAVLLHDERQARLDAETARNRMQTVLDVLPAGVAIYDEQGELLTLNPAGQRLTQRPVQPGEPADERQVRYQMRQRDGQVIVEATSPSGRARRGETFHDEEYIIDGSHGPDTYLLTSGAPLLDAQKEPIGAVVVFQDVTALRAMEQLAQSQRALADAMIDSTPFGIALFEVSDAFQCLRNNDPFLALVGTTHRARGTIVGIALDDLFDTESGARVRAIYEQVRATGQPIILNEFPAVLWPDPTLRWYTWSLTPLMNDQGHVVGLINSATEITETIRGREELREQANRLRAVLDVLPVGVAIADARLGDIQSNAAFRQIWGDIPEVFSPQSGLNFRGQWPDGRTIAPDEWALTRALTSGEVVRSEEIDIVDTRGHHKTILNTAAPIRAADGQVTGAVVAELDITTRKALERRTQATLDVLLAMAQSLGAGTGEPLPVVAHRISELTRQVLGCTRVSITAIDAVTRTLHAIAVVGLTPEEERDWWAMQNDDARLDDSADPELLRRFLAGEILILNMGEPPYDVQPNPFGVTVMLLAPMRNDAHVVGFISLDFSGEPHTFSSEEVELARGVASLGAVIFERERLLELRAAAEAQALAMTQANQRMDAFMGIASHELRTPITSMKMQTQIALRKVREYLNEHHAAAASLDQVTGLLVRSDRVLERLNRLVGDLLDSSRIQTGKLNFVQEACDLVQIVRDVVEEQRVIWPQRVIELDSPSDPLPLFADSERIRQVVTNYLTNALKYSATPEPISVWVARMGDVGRVAVRDRGPGIPPEEQGRIWERFHQAEGVEVRSGSGVGLGLGLHICKTLIERQGGQVGVISVADFGSTFWFTLPLAHPDARARR